MNEIRSRLWVAGILVGLAVVVALVIVLLEFGRKNPSPPSLADHPNPAIPGTLAYSDRDGRLWIVEASGASRQRLRCETHIDWVSWIDAETIGYASSRGGRGPSWIAVTLETGETEDRGEAFFRSAPLPTRADGAYVEIDGDGTVSIVEDGQRSVLYEEDYPDGYRPHPIAWSPDGEWLLLQYWLPRGEGAELWIVAADGTVSGTIASDVRGSSLLASWWIDGFGSTPDIGPDSN